MTTWVVNASPELGGAAVSVVDYHEVDGANVVPTGQLGLLVGDPDAGAVLIIGKQVALYSMVEQMRWHLLDPIIIGE